MENKAFKAALSYAIDLGLINSDTPVDEALSGYKSIYYDFLMRKAKLYAKFLKELSQKI